MKYLLSDTSNYDKYPFVNVDGYEKECFIGWNEINKQLKYQICNINKKKTIIVAECYIGIYESLLVELTKELKPSHIFLSSEVMLSHQEIDKMVFPDITEDEIFGFITRLKIENFFNPQKMHSLQEEINQLPEGVILVYGTAASLLAKADILLYFDMPRWEGQLRFRRNEVANLGADNKDMAASLQYKRAFFVDWRVCDYFKKKIMPEVDFLIDTVDSFMPKMITVQAFRQGLKNAVRRPFRVVPFFDPGPWGGQWMKEICNLDITKINYAWCFDCVIEENSLLLKFGDVLFETPSINLVFFFPEDLLGNAVYGRFGDEFPIRFDFLDTMEGGNLSLQVHPLTQYIQENFGIHYTQDESYYLLDVGDNSCVYLGLKENIDAEEMIAALKTSEISGSFDAEKYVEKWTAKKHDHFLIPAGTIHCSGTNAMVLEISATPYIFTFKLWDWNRLGMNGLPRPINIGHGTKNIQWNRTTEWTKNNLINKVSIIAEGLGWKEEKTGLHENEFIETRRHWFSEKVIHFTNGGFNVLNLIEGEEAIVESEDHEFEPLIVHYAETFIIPAFVKKYTIQPYGKSIGKLCGTIKAFVRTQA
ncbi:MAG: class I mannose-6-phosphate isomerase [Bacteroidales bacterium]